MGSPDSPKERKNKDLPQLHWHIKTVKSMKDLKEKKESKDLKGGIVYSY